VTEDDTFVPLFTLDETLVLDFEAVLAEETLLPDLLEAPDICGFALDDFEELLTDELVLTERPVEVFAVSLLHATPIQGRLDELETNEVVFAEVFAEVFVVDQGFSVSLLHG
jgi:hypothetical protein